MNRIKNSIIESTLRMTSAFRTVSEEAVCVIARMMPILVLAEERQSLHQQQDSSTSSLRELRTKERQLSIDRCPIPWYQPDTKTWCLATSKAWRGQLIQLGMSWPLDLSNANAFWTWFVSERIFIASNTRILQRKDKQKTHSLCASPGRDPPTNDPTRYTCRSNDVIKGSLERNYHFCHGGLHSPAFCRKKEG